MPLFDVLLLENEPDFSPGTVEVYHPFNDETLKVEASKVEKLTTKVFDKGEILIEQKTLKEKREIVLRQIESFDKNVVIDDEKEYIVYLSKQCKETFDSLLTASKV